MIKKLITGVVVSAALLASAPAFATTFVLTSASNSALSGAAGNSTSFTVGGITVTATAWSTAGYATPVTSDLPQTAYLGKYTAGLGVTDSGDGSGSGNQHTIDNVGRYDFIRLVFSTPVKLTGATLTGFDVTNDNISNVDTDAWLSYGSTAAGAFNTAALWQGYLTNGTYVASGSSFSSSNSGTVWLIGAAHTSTDRDDGFKLTSVTVTPSLPEPATWTMMLLGFGVVGAGLRRRAANTKAGTARLQQTV